MTQFIAMGYNPNLIPKAGLLPFDCRKGIFGFVFDADKHALNWAIYQGQIPRADFQEDSGQFSFSVT